MHGDHTAGRAAPRCRGKRAGDRRDRRGADPRGRDRAGRHRRRPHGRRDGKAGGEIVTLPVASKNPFTILANVRRLQRLIDERDVDLVHARSRAPAWSALLAARRTGRPFVTTYHGAYGKFGPFKAAYNSVMARGDRVIANSRYTAKLIAARASRAQERIRVIYRGIDSATFDPAASCRRGRSPSSASAGGSRRAPRSCCMPRGSPG